MLAPTTVRRQRPRLTARQKLAVIESTRSLSLTSAAESSGVSRSTIALWRNSEGRLRQTRASAAREPSLGSFGARADATAPGPMSGSTEFGDFKAGDSTSFQFTAPSASAGCRRPQSTADSGPACAASEPVAPAAADAGRPALASEILASSVDVATPDTTVIDSHRQRPPGELAAQVAEADHATTIDACTIAEREPERRVQAIISSEAGAAAVTDRGQAPQESAAVSAPATPGLAGADTASVSRQDQDAADVVLVGFPGLGGALADVAVTAVFSALQVGDDATSANCVTVGYTHMNDMMDAIETREIEFGAVTTAALLSVTYDFLLSQFASRPLKIVGEIAARNHVCLSCHQASQLSDCDCVMTEFALLQQYEPEVQRMEAARGGPIVRQVTWDSASACASVRDEDAKGIAVIATKRSALDAGLKVLVEDLDACSACQHDSTFLLIGRSDSPPLRARASPMPHSPPVAKACLLASMRNQSNWLANLTQVFAELGLHIVDIQTRISTPLTNRAQDHQVVVSYLTASGAAQQARLFVRLQTFALSMQPLGTYCTFAVL